MGIEPTLPAWKAEVLPLNDLGIYLRLPAEAPGSVLPYITLG